MRNYSEKSNYMCGSSELDLLPFYVQSLNIPGITFTLPEIGGRFGTKINLSSDNVQYNSLSLQIILDEDYQIYKDITKIIFNHLDVEKGSFAEFSFDFWVQVTDSLGRSVMKIEYYNCKIESLGDLELDSMDDSTESSFSLDLQFDYYKIFYGDSEVPSLAV